MKVGFVGAGKVGFSLGRFLAEKGIQVIGYLDRHPESAVEAACFTGTKAYEQLADLIHECDVIFLTVPDGIISSMYQEVSKYEIKGKQICHCSGAMSMEDAFAGIHGTGASGVSIHPLFPVSNKYESYKEMPGAFFCLQGDAEAVDIWKGLFDSWNMSSQIIPAEGKVRYHAGCAIASNLVCALLQESLELLQSCGFTEQGALKAITPLVKSNIEHILSDGPVNALTGPVERGDVQTVSKHLTCLENARDLAMYKSVTEKLVDVAQKKNPDRDYTDLRELLGMN